MTPHGGALPADPASIVDAIILRALEEGATDIHFAPAHGGGAVRMRVDGLLRDVYELDAAVYPKVVSRIKVLGEMDIAERRKPQDGRFSHPVEDRAVDLRVSSIPALHGESIVLRLLDRAAGLRDLDGLGMPQREAQLFSSFLAEPSGLIIVTGPTGAGKSTTLYAALQRLAIPEQNVLSIEDPIEYEVPRVLQTALQPKIGVGFAGLLRSILRHDPDVIMVGEVRDAETAEVCVRASLTGHLVLTSLHTHRAADAVSALLNFGVKPYALAPALRGVVAQQLIRVICPECKTSFEYGDAALADPDLAGLLPPGRQPSFSVGLGCERCFGSGYRGRRAVFEVLDVSGPVQEAVLRGAHADDVEKAAVEAGMSTLRRNGFRAVLEGWTTVEEVVRAVHLS
jgi:type II secretory ATPase GspE/PulE/Tfp pilus assembly ATPase PilB-like protein